MTQDLVPSPGGTSVSAMFSRSDGSAPVGSTALLAGTAQTAEYRLSSLTKVKAALKLLHGLQIWLWSSSPPTESRILWQSRILWWTAVWSRLPSAGLSATGLLPAGLSAAARVSPARVSGKLWASSELVASVRSSMTGTKLTRL